MPYVGRIIAVGRTEDGKLAGLYRVSSRSFPNRHAVQSEDRAAIVPRPGHEADIQKNPYIAYNCLRFAGTKAVVSNGTHTDFIADKLNDGLSARDALTAVLHGMDFEHDHLSTPRIACIVDPDADEAWLGIVSADSVIVRKVTPAAGQVSYVATYEHTLPGGYGGRFGAGNAADACEEIICGGVFAELEKPVSAVCVVAGADGYDIACKEADA